MSVISEFDWQAEAVRSVLTIRPLHRPGLNRSDSKAGEGSSVHQKWTLLCKNQQGVLCDSVGEDETFTTVSSITSHKLSSDSKTGEGSSVHQKWTLFYKINRVWFSWRRRTFATVSSITSHTFRIFHCCSDSKTGEGNSVHQKWAVFYKTNKVHFVIRLEKTKQMSIFWYCIRYNVT